MELTDTQNPDYYHKVVDCQYACPAHTPVPKYIRLIAQRRYTEAYLVNRESNVFPGILGRVCDRPCEPACRRGRVDEAPVAICRLKRVAADLKNDDEVQAALPAIPAKKNGKKVALVGAGPASLTVINDLLQLGYHCTLFDEQAKPGGAMRAQVPGFRLPEEVLDAEIAMVLDRGGVTCHFNTRIDDLTPLFKDFDAVFCGIGAAKGRDLDIPGRKEADAFVHIGIEFLANVRFEHLKRVSKEVLVIGGGNTAMDCARTALRLGANSVTIVAPESLEEMLASPWEKEDALHEGIVMKNHLLPDSMICKDGVLISCRFKVLESCYNKEGLWQPTARPGEMESLICDQVIVAIGQSHELNFQSLPTDIKYSNREHHQLQVDQENFQSSYEKLFVGGDAAWGPKNIIWAVEHGHQAAISIDLYCRGKDPKNRPQQSMTLLSEKLTMNSWTYKNSYDPNDRQLVPAQALDQRLKDPNLEVEQGFDDFLAQVETSRCLNCDVQTVFTGNQCIECDACVDICPVDCLAIEPNASEEELRQRIRHPANNRSQALFSDTVPQTKRLMLKDENLCLHCGLCAERCPTSAWDMQTFELKIPKATGVNGCQL